MRGKVYILVYCPIDTLQWGTTHSAMMADAELPSRVMQPQASSTSSGNLWKGRLLSDEALWENVRKQILKNPPIRPFLH